MNKHDLLDQIIAQLKRDHELLLDAARHAHATATDDENIPDDKYETFALEASYIAQGQANRAQEIALAIQTFSALKLQSFDEDSELRLSALVELEDEQGQGKWVFIAPAAGGLSIEWEQRTVQLVTAPSPLGQGLIGALCGDVLEVGGKEYEIVSVS